MSTRREATVAGGEVTKGRGARPWLWRAALAGLLLAWLSPGLVLAEPAARTQPAAPPATTSAKVVSPYARYARDHARSVAAEPVKVKPQSFAVGHAPRIGQHPKP